MLASATSHGHNVRKINSELALEHATDDDPWATEYLHRHPAGSGAYQVERWEPGQQLVYRRNPQWASGALPSAERIILREVPSSATRRALLERGNAHLSQDVPPRDALELDAHPNVQVVSTPIENCLHVLCPNLAFEPFQDVRVRQAIAWAIPYDAILQNAPTVAGCQCGAPRAAPLPIPIGHSRSPTTPTSSAPGLDDPAYAPKIRRMIEIAFEDVPRIPLFYVFYYLLGWAPSPMGRLDFLYLSPPRVTGFYVIDALIARDLETARAALAQLALPAITLGLFTLAPIARMTRAAMLQILEGEFIRTARAAGLPRRQVLFTYALRNAVLPVITTLGMVFSFALGANVLVEKVFSWPGIGSYAVEALVVSDYAAVQGFVLTMALLFVTLNLIIDIIYTLVDPRLDTEA